MQNEIALLISLISSVVHEYLNGIMGKEFRSIQTHT